MLRSCFAIQIILPVKPSQDMVCWSIRHPQFRTLRGIKFRGFGCGTTSATPRLGRIKVTIKAFRYLRDLNADTGFSVLNS